MSYRLEFNGFGKAAFLSISLGTASEEECRRRAPDMARQMKKDYGCRTVVWKLVPA